jgi:hypothetical protein
MKTTISYQECVSGVRFGFGRIKIFKSKVWEQILREKMGKKMRGRWEWEEKWAENVFSQFVFRLVVNMLSGRFWRGTSLKSVIGVPSTARSDAKGTHNFLPNPSEHLNVPIRTRIMKWTLSPSCPGTCQS